MLFKNKAQENKQLLLEKWIDLFYSSYPLGSAGFVRTSDNKFTNPVGTITKTNLEVLYNAVIGEDVKPAAVQEALLELVKLRAIQNMEPSKAVGPLVQMKKVFKEETFAALKKENTDSKSLVKLFDEYFIVEARIDSLFLMALDYYASQKEAVFNLRVEEVHRNQSQVVRWAKLREDKQKTNHNTEG